MPKASVAERVKVLVNVPNVASKGRSSSSVMVPEPPKKVCGNFVSTLKY